MSVPYSTGAAITAALSLGTWLLVRFDVAGRWVIAVGALLAFATGFAMQVSGIARRSVPLPAAEQHA